MENLNSNDKIADLYKKIQDIPYQFSLPKGPEFLLEKNKGVCSEKHLFLAKKFRELGMPVKFLLIKFDWRKLPIPKKITNKRKDPIDWHLALKIKPDKKWINLDATWDSKLENSGLPVVKNWNGKSGTDLAVKPISIIELPLFVYKFLKILIQKRKGKNTEFQEALNRWLEEKRISKSKTNIK